MTIRSSPPGSKLTLVARGFEELAVNATSEEPGVSLDGHLNLLLSVLLGRVKMLELDALSIVLIRVTDRKRLMLGGTISVNSAVVTSEEDFVARKVFVEMLLTVKKNGEMCVQ